MKDETGTAENTPASIGIQVPRSSFHLLFWIKPSDATQIYTENRDQNSCLSYKARSKLHKVKLFPALAGLPYKIKWTHTLEKPKQQFKLRWQLQQEEGSSPPLLPKSIYDLGSLYGELRCEFNIFPPTEGGHRTCIFHPLPGQILKSFSYSGYKDCKYHIHFFQPNIEKKNTPKHS